MRIESMALAAVDGAFAAALRELVPGKFPSEDTFHAIAYFIGIQYSRLPSFARIVSATYKKHAEEIMRMMAANVARMKSVLDKYSRETGEELNVSPESMVEAVREKKIEVVVSEVPFIKLLFRQAESLSELIVRLSWRILVASPESGFILCDNPVVIVPPRGVVDAGFVVPGSVKYFPLSRKLCLRLEDFGNSFAYRNVDRQTVRVINQNIAAHSERFIMGPVRAQLENVVMRSGSTEPELTPRFTLETVEESDSDSLQKITQKTRRYFYSAEANQTP